MKLFYAALTTVCMLMPNAVLAQYSTAEIQQQMMQQFEAMSPAEREAMISGMQKNAEAMQTCLNEAGGQDALQELQTLGDAHNQKVKSLCAKGDREKAQAYAQDASQEMLKDPRVGKLRNCSRMALQNMPQLAQLAETGGIDTNKHVCD